MLSEDKVRSQCGEGITETPDTNVKWAVGYDACEENGFDCSGCQLSKPVPKRRQLSATTVNKPVRQNSRASRVVDPRLQLKKSSILSGPKAKSPMKRKNIHDFPFPKLKRASMGGLTKMRSKDLVMTRPVTLQEEHVELADWELEDSSTSATKTFSRPTASDKAICFVKQGDSLLLPVISSYGQKTETRSKSPQDVLGFLPKECTFYSYGKYK